MRAASEVEIDTLDLRVQAQFGLFLGDCADAHADEAMRCDLKYRSGTNRLALIRMSADVH